MEILDIVCFSLIIIFIILLASAIFMLVNFYICDRHACKAFVEANTRMEDIAIANDPTIQRSTEPIKSPMAFQASAEYIIALMGELYNDGIWPIPYIGSAILTPLSLFIMKIPITVYNFTILFLISFFVIYSMLSFFGHHYVRIITGYVTENLRSKVNTNTSDKNTNVVIDDPNETVCHNELK